MSLFGTFTDYTPTSLKAENDICDTQIIVNFLLCEILSLMKILRLHGRNVLIDVNSMTSSLEHVWAEDRTLGALLSSDN